MAYFRLFVDDSRPFPSNGYECCTTVGDLKTLLLQAEFLFNVRILGSIKVLY